MLVSRLVIGNDLAELRPMTHWLQEACEAAGTPQDLVFKLDVCANEAVTNIISYAYLDALRHDIILELNPTANGARLVVRDDGKPFNAMEAPEHEAPASLDEAKIGGLGIHLMRRLMTRCNYQRVAGYNVLSLEVERKLQADLA